MRCIGREGMIAGYKLVELGPTWKASTARSRFQNQKHLKLLGCASCLLLKKEHQASLFFSAKSASGRWAVDSSTFRVGKKAYRLITATFFEHFSKSGKVFLMFLEEFGPK